MPDVPLPRIPEKLNLPPEFRLLVASHGSLRLRGAGPVGEGSSLCLEDIDSRV